MKPRRLVPSLRPLAASLTRFKTLVGMAAAMGLASQQSASAAPVTWEGITGGTPGDGLLWFNPLNWQGDLLPAPADDLTFGAGAPGLIQLGGNQTANSLTFNANFTLGTYGTNQVLTNTTGNVVVTPGDFATINASYGGTNGINLSGGGSLFLNHPLPTFGGNITVAGPGTSLVYRGEGLAPQYNGVGNAQEFGRFDQLTLGFTTAAKTITLTNGGEYKIIGAGNNSEGGTKNIVIGAGGGTINLAAGYLVQNLDDNGQIGVTTEAFTKTGKGRLIITGATALAAQNPFQGVVNINGGMLSLDAIAAGRFLGIAATGTTVNVNNGGTLFMNNGTVANFDIPTVNLNDGGTIAFNGNVAHVLGLNGGGTTLNVTGTGNILFRELFGQQNERLYRIRTDITGNGTIVAVPNTNAGGNPRMVIERNNSNAFTGTFRLPENMAIEANPRNMPTVDTGKVLGQGDVDFAGWASRLDVRDSTATTSVFDYTTNNLLLTSAQQGSLPRIVVGRATLGAGAGHLFNFGTLTMGNQRLSIEGNNSYQVGISETASIQGNSVIIMSSDNTPLVFSKPVAIAEDAAGRSLTFLKSGLSNSGARDVIVGGGINVSNLNVATGTLQLRGANGAIGAGFGGAAPTVTVNGSGLVANGSALPTAGLLHLDNNTGHVVGTNTVFAAANNPNRIIDSATLNLAGNSTLRLTSLLDAGSTETIGTTNVFGHGTFDLVKTGTATAPVALTLTTLNMGANATANFTGTALGTTGANTSRIVLPGTATGPLNSRFHVNAEFAKYDSSLDTGVEIGVTPFVAADYAINSAEGTWAAGQVLKQNGATGITLTGNRNADRLNLQFTAANQSINTGGFILSLEQGGLMNGNTTGGQTAGIVGVAGVGGLTAGTTTPASLYVHTTNTLEIMVPIIDNLGANLVPGGGDDSAVTFVKSGPGTVVLSHHSRTVGQAQIAGAPFVTPTWSSTNTGGWVINDGVLNVHRGQFLGATPTTVTLNGGQLEINEPASNANADSIIPGWGHHIVVNGNAMIGFDDNGESNDANTGDRTLVKFGSLTVNNGAILGMAAFSENDIAFMGGATFNSKANLNIGAGNRSGVTNANIISGVIAGSGFDVLALGGNGATLVLGGSQGDATNNTYNGTVTIYGATVRLNKANGVTAITDGSASEDVIINGGNLFWGPGHHGDLTATNNVTATNNGLLGITPNSPAAIKNAGMNQIADTATITLLTGTLGESDRITNEKFGSLIMKNGTLNVGLGTMEMDTATFSGGALGFDRGGTLKIGQATYLPGSFDQSVFTGLPTPGGQTTLEIGAGGISLTGQHITLGNGFSASVAGSGGRLRLGGNLSFTGDDLIGGSYARKGIFVQNGSSFRELGTSHVDLMGGTRDFAIATDSFFTITAPIINGAISKSGGGSLVLEPYQPSSFNGLITVNNGTLWARADGAFGTNAGGVTINSGGTVKLESSWTYGDNFIVSGPGATVPGEANVREPGALVSETGTNRLTGGVTLAGNATIASNAVPDPSATPVGAGAAYRISNLIIESPGGITGSGDLTLSGHGDGEILGGVNTTSGGLFKEGAGRWTISGASSLAGPATIAAGTLRVTDGGALGGTAAGTTVLNGATLELAGGISLAEPLSLIGNGGITQSGALVNVSGANTITGAITLNGNATLRSDSGTLSVINSVTGTNGTLTLSGSGNGMISGAIDTGAFGLPGLVKSGTGTWTLAGANALAGTITVAGGTLEIDFRTQNNNKINTGEPLTMSGGDLTVIGHASAPTFEFLNGLNLAAGHASISVSGGTGGATFGFDTFNRSAGATVDFKAGPNGTIATDGGVANVNGIVGGYATAGGTDWATLSAVDIVPYGSYSPLNLGGGADAANSRITSAEGVVGSVTTNSLKIADGTGLRLGANNLTLTSGGLLFTGSQQSGITGTGLVSGSSPADELIVHTASGLLDIATPIIGAGSGGLTKAGNGTLVLSGVSAFTGPIHVNEGTLSIVGPGGATHPTTLGSAAGPRNLNINGGTFEVVGGDYDSGATGMYYVIGSGGGTIRSSLGSVITINDVGTGAGQFSGSGDLTLTGGGRYNFTGGTPQFPNFTGRVTVDGGILNVGNGANTGFFPLGTSSNQTITLKPGSAIINQVNFGVGQNGLVNNIVAEGGVEFFAAGGNRVYAGDIQLSGTNTIALFERDTLNQERQVFFNGRVSGTGVTLNVFGANFGNPFYLTSGGNDLSGTINLNANAVLEARMPGSLGLNAGDLTVNLQGANSRLFLRHYQNGDYRANVNVANTSEINSARLAGFAGGASQLLSINNLTSSTNGILTLGGSDAYTTRVAGTATLSANTILNTTSGNLLLENGLNFTGGANTLDKRGAGSILLHGAANHTGPTIVQGGVLIVQEGGTLANTSGIDIRGGELRVENSTVVNSNRLNDAAPVTLGGGALRITGDEAIGTVSAVAGTTQIAFNPTSETVVSALTLPGFTRALGAVVQFQSDFTTTGARTVGSSRVSARVLIPGQANTTQTIPGLVGNNNVDFIQYDGTTIDGGQPLGVRDMRNPGTLNAPNNYSDNSAETAWNDSVILRRTVTADDTVATDALTANRALDAIKVEAGGNNRDVVINLTTFNLRIEGGGILDVGNGNHDFSINGTTGTLTAGPAIPGAGIAELFIGGSSGGAAFNINAIIANNGTQPVALVKTGANTVSFNGNNTFTGGLFVTSGTANTTNPNGFGSAPGTITLAGGILQFNVASASTGVDLGVPDHAINVLSNSLIVLDNGALTPTLGTDNDISLGAITIGGPYTLGLRGFDSMDATFAGPHTFTGTPTLDMAQAGGGSNASNFTLSGAIAGSGFYVTSSGGTDNTAGILQIGGGEAIANTYTGKVTVLLPGSFGEDLRVELNKAPGTAAITGDLEIQGGTVRNLADNQIADTSNIVITQGQYDAFGKNETVASITMTGGNFRTSSPATGGSTFTVTGDINATGLDDTTGSGDGVAVNSNTTLIVNGTLKLNGYSRGTIGQTLATLVVGGLELTGTTLSQGGAGALMRLNGDVTTFASSNPARLGATTTAGAQIQLNGSRIFNVADGSAGLDLVVSTALTDSTAPVAVGSLVKNGPGTMQLEGAGLANAYTGGTTINSGSVVLFKNAGTNAIPAGAVTLGDGVGGAKADQLIVRNSNQIADAASLTIASSGVLDLSTFNTSETIGSLSGSGNVDLGPGSVFTVNGSVSTTYAGSIYGAGSLVKDGSGVLDLTGANQLLGGAVINGTGGLFVNGSLEGNVTLNAGVLGGDGSILGSVTVNGGTLSPGNSPGSLATGSLSLAAGTLAAEIVTVSSYDSVNVTGTVTLGGSLSLSGAYVPSLSDSFYLIINDGVDSIANTFAGIAQSDFVIVNGVPMQATYTADFEGNNPYSLAGNDFALIPEPGSATLLLGGLGSLLVARRRRRTA